MKKFICVFLLIIYTLTSCIFCNVGFAENENKTTASEKSDQKENSRKSETKKEDKSEKEDKSGKEEKVEEEPKKEYSPKAEYILVCDVESGFPAYTKNSGKSINPYGLTKILTAITVIENVDDLDKKITVPAGILKDYDYSYGNIGLMSGEKISVKNLIYAMFFQDAGDCALALAHTTAKSYNEFIKLMNDTAAKAGAKASVFTEPAGFNESPQKTTLNDMAAITSYALKNKIFSEIVKNHYIKIDPTNKAQNNRVLFSTNKFLSKYYSEDYYNPNVYGVKGYYKDSNDTGLIIRYSVGNDDLLILTAKSSEADKINYAYEDTIYLMKKYTGYFTKVSIMKKDDFVSEHNIRTGKNADRVLLVSLDDIIAKLPTDYKSSLITKEIKLNDNIDAPLKKYEDLGEINVYYDGIKIGSAIVAANNEIKKSILKSLRNIMVDIITSIYFWIIAVLVIFIVRITSKRKRNSKKTKSR